eukprot:CAMPEP_0114989870 /NCGR_PEP_ID=MMETSP0216-20121206/10446_1 /TAXON_ID=223996 /ORGANISM="Protocruzia adherens, Strain Boccale" /LENGTH=490 /DNA_ID=CAMNT_0002352913 /DNA_START=28 /DNA_END=1500 /DNA_ORIENTATION=-
MDERHVIVSLSWVSKGYARIMPVEYTPNEEEKQELKDEVEKELGEGAMDQANEEDDEDEQALPVFGSGMEGNPDDPYPLGFDDLDRADKDDYSIRKTDSLIVTATTEEEFSSLDVYLYEENKNNLFVHHDIMLSAFPLCTEWLPYNPSTAKSANMLIVGTFLPGIEIWDLDVLDALEPVTVLGGQVEESRKKILKKKKKSNLKPGSHADAVLSLNVHPTRHNILASGSADQTVKVWDITQSKCVHTYNHHSNKVQVVRWNPKEESVLLTGSFDQTVHVFDASKPENSISCKLDGDLESAAWNPNNHMLFAASTESGSIVYQDARSLESKPVMEFKAHDKAVSAISFSKDVPSMLASVSTDKRIKIWDLDSTVETSTGVMPKLIAEKVPKNADELFCCSFYQDSPWVLAAGGRSGELIIWDTAENPEIVKTFSDRVSEQFRPNLEECTLYQDGKPVGEEGDEDMEMQTDINAGKAPGKAKLKKKRQEDDDE